MTLAAHVTQNQIQIVSDAMFNLHYQVVATPQARRSSWNVVLGMEEASFLFLLVPMATGSLVVILYNVKVNTFFHIFCVLYVHS